MKKDKIFFYGLSTCIWCKKTRALLDLFDVEYDFVYMDELEGEEREAKKEELRQHNPAISYPTVLIGDDCVIGYQEEQLRRLLAKWPKKK